MKYKIGVEHHQKCRKLRVKHPRLWVNGKSSSDRYRSGLKYCTTCREWFEPKYLKCPCCNYKLRTRPRSRRSKVESKRVS